LDGELNKDMNEGEEETSVGRKAKTQDPLREGIQSRMKEERKA